MQSNLIFKRMRQLAEEKEKQVYVFCEDVAASGGYFLAIAGDEIYCRPVVHRRVHRRHLGQLRLRRGDRQARHRAARLYGGPFKSTLDPFLPEKPDDVARLKSIQNDVHDVFIGLVKERRAGKLKAPDAELFSGAFWAGAKAAELGLIDGISDVRSKMRELHGDDVRLQVVEAPKTGLLGRLRRLTPNVDALGGGGLAFADDLVSAIETRALWSRYGL